MKLPWQKKDERIEQLQQEKARLKDRMEELEDELGSMKERYEAEKQRRSELARKKQEAEEKLNRLEDSREPDEDEDPVDEDTGDRELQRADFGKTYQLLQRLDSVESPGDDLLTVYSPGKVDGVEDFRGLKNAATPEQMAVLRETDSFAAFLEPGREPVLLKTRPVFNGDWSLDSGFDTSPLMEFIESEKILALVSAGETRIFRESRGDYEQVDRVRSRVDRQHSKGGFSQDRFERKRDEQVEQHLEEVEETLQGRENVYLLGDRRLCEELPGEHLGGFDPNLRKPEVFYSFQRLSLTWRTSKKSGR
ncbi:MAG: Vms1/Ankzf1 family peptidyl-tRNA hydrolase [Candidatus Nanohaloarchaea archaeon]